MRMVKLSDGIIDVEDIVFVSRDTTQPSVTSVPSYNVVFASTDKLAQLSLKDYNIILDTLFSF